MAYKLIGATATRWYKILSYIGPNTITQLPKHIISVKLTEFETNKRALLKIKCEVYLLVKHI